MLVNDKYCYGLIISGFWEWRSWTKCRGTLYHIKSYCRYRTAQDLCTQDSYIRWSWHVLYCAAAQGILNHYLEVMLNINRCSDKIDNFLGHSPSRHYMAISSELLDKISPESTEYLLDIWQRVVGHPI